MLLLQGWEKIVICWVFSLISPPIIESTGRVVRADHWYLCIVLYLTGTNAEFRASRNNYWKYFLNDYLSNGVRANASDGIWWFVIISCSLWFIRLECFKIPRSLSLRIIGVDSGGARNWRKVTHFFRTDSKSTEKRDIFTVDKVAIVCFADQCHLLTLKILWLVLQKTKFQDVRSIFVVRRLDIL